MDMLDRYLQAVRWWLPATDKDDIVAELREDLRSQIDERESQVGRPLTDAEVGDILKRRGRPAVVAGRFLPQQYLIGPTVYPMFRAALKVAAIVFLIQSAVWPLLPMFFASMRGKPVAEMAVGAWAMLWHNALLAFGALTVVFAAIERFDSGTRAFERWNPRNLPRVRDGRRIPRASSIAELVITVLFIGWWVQYSRGLPASLTIPASVHWKPGPIWTDFRRIGYWPVLVVSIVNAATAAVNLVRPYWTRLRLGIRAAGNVAMATTLGIVLEWNRAGAKVGIARLKARPPLTGIALATTIGDVTLYITFACVGLGCAIAALVEIVRMIRLKPAPGI